MKILFFTSSLSTGGAERIACTLVNAWASRGDQVILMPTFSGRGECFYELYSDVRLVYLSDLISSTSRSCLNRIVRLRAMRRFIAKERPDVIVSFLFNVNVATIIAAAGLRIPVVICERTDPFVMPISFFIKIGCWITYRFAKVLVVQTQAVCDKYRSSSYAIREIKVIPNPIARPFLEFKHCVSNRSTSNLIAVGRLDEGKQFDVLIRVFSKIAKQHSTWSLQIFGEGPLRSVLQQEIIDCGLDSRISLMGRTKNIASAFAQADVFVMTSRYEGFPNVLLEAMAIGLPSVTFDCPSGPKEITINGKIAILVPLNDEIKLEKALQQIMTDDSLRKYIGRKARESVRERYSLSSVLQHWNELFSRIGATI
jgi:GalNAc-alpha-(1->4)-GalNAc-alpha-(1->3)-diNAcBac-PP-undecaprenol alpha-1,4-N-acetyl-D-galactosaminyltransferase